jgi:hypothetical protein
MSSDPWCGHARCVAGPIAAERPQALMFGAKRPVPGSNTRSQWTQCRRRHGSVGRTFAKLPPYAGVQHEYTLHVLFVENHRGLFVDFNPA